MPRLHEDEFEALMDKKTREEFKTKQAEAMLHIPNTWQYYCLMFQEGLVATPPTRTTATSSPSCAATAATPRTTAPTSTTTTVVACPRVLQAAG